MQENNSKPINFYNYASPVTNLTPEQIKKIKREQSKLAWVVRGCIFVGIIVIACVAVFFYQMSPLNTNNNVITPTVAPTTNALVVNDYSNISYNLNYIQRITPQGVKVYSRPEIDLALLIYQKAFDKKWPGDISKLINFTINDIDAQQINRILLENTNNDTAAKIPTDIQNLIYGDSAKTVLQTLKDARAEYIQFAKDYPCTLR